MAECAAQCSPGGGSSVLFSDSIIIGTEVEKMSKKPQSAFLYIQLFFAAIVAMVVIAIVWAQVSDGSSAQGSVIFGLTLVVAVAVAAVLVRRATRRR